MSTLSKPKIKQNLLSRRLLVFLEELGEECQNVNSLLSQIRLQGLTQEQIRDILLEFQDATTHLHVHTQDMADRIEEEIESIERRMAS